MELTAYSEVRACTSNKGKFLIASIYIDIICMHIHGYQDRRTQDLPQFSVLYIYCINISMEHDSLLQEDDDIARGIELEPLSLAGLVPDDAKNLAIPDYTPILDDIKGALYEARLWGPISSLIGFAIAFYLSTSPYQIPKIYDKQILISDDHLKNIRPLLLPLDIEQIMTNTMYAETKLEMPNSDQVGFKFFMSASPEGHFRLPDQFYEGVTFAITSENPFAHTGSRLEDLREDLERLLHPPPTHIMTRVTQNHNTGWTEHGFAVYYSQQDLKTHKKLSNDVDDPWQDVRADVMVIARKYKQTHVTQWMPHAFGADHPTDANLNKAIVQLVFPTRTGLGGIESSVVVWLTATNGIEPKRPRKFYRKSDLNSNFTKGAVTDVDIDGESDFDFGFV
eukprot:gene1995-3883_t